MISLYNDAEDCDAASSLEDKDVKTAVKTTTIDGIGVDLAMADACNTDPQQAFEYSKDFGSFDAANSGFVALVFQASGAQY